MSLYYQLYVKICFLSILLLHWLLLVIRKGHWFRQRCCAYSTKNSQTSQTWDYRSHFADSQQICGFLKPYNQERPFTDKVSARQRRQQCMYHVWRPLVKKSTASQRKKHNVEKYIQWFTTLPLAIRAYLHSFSCFCLPNLRNIAIFSENSTLVSIESALCNFLLVINCNFGRISYTVFEILTHLARKYLVFPPHLCCTPLVEERPGVST